MTKQEAIANHRKMNNAVVISIRPKWCELIADGKKTVEVRKTRPKLATPFKCYIYCTQDGLLTKSQYNGRIYVATNKKCQKVLERNGNITLSGKVIGEFVCDKIADLRGMGGEEFYQKSRMTYEDWRTYTDGSESAIYGWHISELKIYDEPKEINSFYRYVPQRILDSGDYDCGFDGLCLDAPEGSSICFECPFGGRIYLNQPPQSWRYLSEKEDEQ